MINLLNDVGIYFLSNELYLTGKNKLKIVYYYRSSVVMDNYGYYCKDPRWIVLCIQQCK